MKIFKSKIFWIAVIVVVAGVLVYMFGFRQSVQPVPVADKPFDVNNVIMDVAQQEKITKQSDSSLITLTSPKGGEKMCQSRPFLISWKAPKGMETMKVYLVVPGVEVEVGSVPAAAGLYTWNVEIQEFPVPVGDGYKLKLGGAYKGEYISKLSEAFSVKDCGLDNSNKNG